LWQGNPGVTNVAIINALRYTASQSVTPDNIMGYGIANFYKAYLLLKKQQLIPGITKPIYLISANPFHERLELIITSPSTLGWTVDVYTIQGKLAERHINVPPDRPIMIGNKIKSGVYILRIISGSQIAIEKIIKN